MTKTSSIRRGALARGFILAQTVDKAFDYVLPYEHTVASASGTVDLGEG